ncbi:MAG: hypothetical protein ACRC7O_10390, partial [Fimbriiglobus sp.]
MMPQVRFGFLTLAAAALAIAPATAQTLDTGNLVVLSVNGISGSGVATAISLNEFTTAGVAQDTISLPSTGTNRLTVSGSAGSEGGISLSGNSARIIVNGYDADVGTAAVSTTANANRAINSYAFGTAGGAELRLASVTEATAFDNNNFRSATSDTGLVGSLVYGTGNGTAGTNGVMQFTPTTQQTSSTITNTRWSQVVNSTLFFSTGSGTTRGVFQVGSAGVLPTTSGVTSTSLLTTSTNSFNTAGSPYGFAFNPTGTTAYVADDGGATVRGIYRFDFDGTTWNFS